MTNESGLDPKWTLCHSFGGEGEEIVWRHIDRLGETESTDSSLYSAMKGRVGIAASTSEKEERTKLVCR